MMSQDLNKGRMNKKTQEKQKTKYLLFLDTINKATFLEQIKNKKYKCKYKLHNSLQIIVD